MLGCGTFKRMPKSSETVIGYFESGDICWSGQAVPRRDSSNGNTACTSHLGRNQS